MKDLISLLIHLLATLAKFMGPGGAKAVVADSLLMKQQLLVINRSRKCAPDLSLIERFLLGFWSLFLSPHHIRRSGIIIKPPTLLRFHEALKNRKYQLLYTCCICWRACCCKVVWLVYSCCIVARINTPSKFFTRGGPGKERLTWLTGGFLSNTIQLLTL